MAGHQPTIGEQVGIFAATGSLRDSLSWAAEQRTDIVVVPFGTNTSKVDGAFDGCVEPEWDRVSFSDKVKVGGRGSFRCCRTTTYPALVVLAMFLSPTLRE
jgi:hypothetical protein